MNLTKKELFTLSAIKSAGGIVYSHTNGATCPWCETRTRVETTGAVKDQKRIRRHRCVNPTCPIHVFGHTIKSVEAIPD